MVEVGEELKLRRILKKLTQTDVARLAGIQRSSLSRYESGEWVPSDEMRRRILEAIARLSPRQRVEHDPVNPSAGGKH